MKTTTPGQELMTSTLRNRRIDLDTEFTQAIYDGLTLDKIVSAPVHVEVVNLLIESIGIGKDSIIGRLDVKTKDRTAKGSHPSTG